MTQPVADAGATTGRHAAPDTSPQSSSTGEERRAAYYPLFVTQPLSTFYGGEDNMDRYHKARKRLAAVVREYCGVDVPVAMTRPIRQMHDDDKTDTFNAAELGIKFTNVTRSELERYCAKLTEVLTGKDRVKLLEGPDYANLVAEPIVEFPDRERIEESRQANAYVTKLAADREANGGSLYNPKDNAAGGEDAAGSSGASKYDAVDEDDLI